MTVEILAPSQGQIRNSNPFSHTQKEREKKQNSEIRIHGGLASSATDPSCVRLRWSNPMAMPEPQSELSLSVFNGVNTDSLLSNAWSLRHFHCPRPLLQYLRFILSSSCLRRFEAFDSPPILDFSRFDFLFFFWFLFLHCVALFLWFFFAFSTLIWCNDVPSIAFFVCLLFDRDSCSADFFSSYYTSEWGFTFIFFK